VDDGKTRMTRKNTPGASSDEPIGAGLRAALKNLRSLAS
jgi:hypothetical protein